MNNMFAIIVMPWGICLLCNRLYAGVVRWAGHSRFNHNNNCSINILTSKSGGDGSDILLLLFYIPPERLLKLCNIWYVIINFEIHYYVILRKIYIILGCSHYGIIIILRP